VIWAIASALVLVTAFAIGQAIFIRRLVAVSNAIEAKPEPMPSIASSEVNNAVVDSLCSSICGKPEQWTFDRGVLKHETGLRVSLTDDGSGVLIKRGKTTAVIGGKDGEKIKEAVIARNLKASFGDLLETLN